MNADWTLSPAAGRSRENSTGVSIAAASRRRHALGLKSMHLRGPGPWPLKLRRLAWGVLVGVGAVLLTEWPRAWAWWACITYEADGLATDPLVKPTSAPAGTSPWAQKVQGLPDEGQAAQAWRALRQLHQAQGLQVLQWQADERVAPVPVWPLSVQRALLVAEGPASSWHTLWKAWMHHPGLWRVEQLSVKPERASTVSTRWRVQARWQMAVRPGTSGAPMSMPMNDSIDTALFRPDKGLPAVPASAPASVPPGGAGSALTEASLDQMRWVGWWRVGSEQEALFLVRGQLHRVQAGQPVGREGHQWQGEVMGQQLILRAAAGARQMQGSPDVVKLELEAVR